MEARTEGVADGAGAAQGAAGSLPHEADGAGGGGGGEKRLPELHLRPGGGSDAWLNYQAFILSEVEGGVAGREGGRETDVAVYLSVGGRSGEALRDVAMSMLLTLEHVEAVVLQGGRGGGVG